MISQAHEFEDRKSSLDLARSTKSIAAAAAVVLLLLMYFGASATGQESERSHNFLCFHGQKVPLHANSTSVRLAIDFVYESPIPPQTTSNLRDEIAQDFACALNKPIVIEDDADNVEYNVRVHVTCGTQLRGCSKFRVRAVTSSMLVKDLFKEFPPLFSDWMETGCFHSKFRDDYWRFHYSDAARDAKNAIQQRDYRFVFISRGGRHGGSLAPGIKCNGPLAHFDIKWVGPEVARAHDENGCAAQFVYSTVRPYAIAYNRTILNLTKSVKRKNISCQLQ